MQDRRRRIMTSCLMRETKRILSWTKLILATWPTRKKVLPCKWLKRISWPKIFLAMKKFLALKKLSSSTLKKTTRILAPRLQKSSTKVLVPTVLKLLLLNFSRNFQNTVMRSKSTRLSEDCRPCTIRSKRKRNLRTRMWRKINRSLSMVARVTSTEVMKETTMLAWWMTWWARTTKKVMSTANMAMNKTSKEKMRAITISCEI